jgi:hypothetical protein
MHVSERLSYFNSRRSDEGMVITLLSHGNEEVVLLKRFYDGSKMTLCCG